MQLRLIGLSARWAFVWILALFPFAFCRTGVRADTKGRQDFDQNSASCHGKEARVMAQRLIPFRRNISSLRHSRFNMPKISETWKRFHPRERCQGQGAAAEYRLPT